MASLVGIDPKQPFGIVQKLRTLCVIRHGRVPNGNAIGRDTPWKTKKPINRCYCFTFRAVHFSCRPCEKSGVRPFTMCVSRALMDFCCRGLESRPCRRLELAERLLPPDFVQLWASFIWPRPPSALRRLEC